MSKYLVIRDRETGQVVYENLFHDQINIEDELADWSEEDYEFEIEELEAAPCLSN